MSQEMWMFLDRGQWGLDTQRGDVHASYGGNAPSCFEASQAT